MTTVDEAFGTREEVDGVEAALETYFASRTARASDYASSYRQLWSTMRSAVRGGKRIRPLLVVSAYRGLSIDERARLAAAFQTAAAFELLHTAFLFHDDVIDRDDVRRGIPNLVGSFRQHATQAGLDGARANRWGEAASIIGGDLLIHDAQRLVALLDVPDAVRVALLDVIDRCLYVTAAGELADVCLASGLAEPAIADVVQMTEHKTAVYSFEGPLTAGAVLAGADAEVVAALAEYGRCMGIAFQLRDDVLGVFGDSSVTGKSVVGDLREGKQTLLMAHARTTPLWERISRLIGRDDLTAEDAARVRATLEECGARDFVASVIADYSRRADRMLAHDGIPDRLRAQLVGAAQQSERRTS